MKKLKPLIGKTIKRVHFARGEAGYLMQLEMSFTDGTSAIFTLDTPKIAAKCALLAAEDEAEAIEVKL